MSDMRLRHSTESHSTATDCGCRTVAECNHDFADLTAEARAIDALVDDFAAHLKEKLHAKRRQGRHGWDDPSWSQEAILAALIDHITEGDMVDVAAFAMFAWNQISELPNSDRPGLIALAGGYRQPKPVGPEELAALDHREAKRLLGLMKHPSETRDGI